MSAFAETHYRDAHTERLTNEVDIGIDAKAGPEAGANGAAGAGTGPDEV